MKTQSSPYQSSPIKSNNLGDHSKKVNKKQINVEKSILFPTSSSSFAAVPEMQISVTTLANQNRRNRLQNGSLIIPIKKTITTTTNTEISSSSITDDPNNNNNIINNTNFRHMRGSALSRRLMGFEEEKKQDMTSTIINNNNVKINSFNKQTNSVDSTKESMSISSQSQDSYNSKPNLVTKVKLISNSRQQINQNSNSQQQPITNNLPIHVLHRPLQVVHKDVIRQQQLDKKVSNFQNEVSSGRTTAALYNSPSTSIRNTNTNPIFTSTVTTQNRTKNEINNNSSSVKPTLHIPSPLIPPRRSIESNVKKTGINNNLKNEGEKQYIETNQLSSSTKSAIISAPEDESVKIETKSMSSTTSRSIASNRAFQNGLARRRIKNGDQNGSPSSFVTSDSKIEDDKQERPSKNKKTSQMDVQLNKSLEILHQNDESAIKFSQQSPTNQSPHRSQRLANQVSPLSQRQSIQSVHVSQGNTNQMYDHHLPTDQVSRDYNNAQGQENFTNGNWQSSINNNLHSSNMHQQSATQYQQILNNGHPTNEQLRQQQFPTSGNRYPVPISPSRPRAPSPPTQFTTQSHGSLAPRPHHDHQLSNSCPLVSFPQPYQSGSRAPPHSHNMVRGTPSLSPAGIPVHRSSHLPQDKHRTHRNSYHNDDEVTLTSVRQIVATSSENPRQNRDVIESSSFKLRSSSTASDSNISPLRQRSQARGNEQSKKKNNTRRRRLGRTASSDYETDQDESGDERNNDLFGENVLKEPSMSAMSASQMTPDVGTFFDHDNGYQQSNIHKDDETYDYGDRDDDSQGSLSYAQRRQKEEREKTARKAAVAAAKAEMEGPFIKTDDVDHYRKTLDTPLSRTALGVAGAATIGCIILGPVGLLVGAAAVGIGIGYMQIPEEQRQNMNNKATEALQNAQESAFIASEKLSTSCATTYMNSGISEHVPPEAQTCCAALASMDKSENVNDEEKSTFDLMGGGGDEQNGEILGNKGSNRDTRNNFSPSNSNRLKNKKEKVACLRQGKSHTSFPTLFLFFDI